MSAENTDGSYVFGYDPKDPPQEAPVGYDRLQWSIAWNLWSDHGDDGQGYCRSWRCQEKRMLREECIYAELAGRGMLAARRLTNKYTNSPYASVTA